MQSLKSRKFWVAVGTILSVLIAEVFGIDISPEALGAIALGAGTYVIGQGLVDKSTVTEHIRTQADTTKLQLELYAKNLEAELEKQIARVEFLQEGPTVVEDNTEPG